MVKVRVVATGIIAMALGCAVGAEDGASETFAEEEALASAAQSLEAEQQMGVTFVPPGGCSPPVGNSTGSTIGAATVGPGLGYGPGAGNYSVRILIESHRRYNIKANDGGHDETFCINPNVSWMSCTQFADFDGVNLLTDSFSYSSGLAASLVTQAGIDGPFHNGTKWEWPDEPATSNLFWGQRYCATKRDILFRADFNSVAWNGSVLSSTYRAKWYEHDPYTWNDYSLPIWVDYGKLLTQCLQTSPLYSWTTIIPASDEKYVDICSDSGGCSAPEHYKIRTYYSAKCYVGPPSSGGGGGGGGCSDCPEPL